MSLKSLCCCVFASSFFVHAASPLLAQSRIIQRNSSRATATGKNNVAASQIRQSAVQHGGTSGQPQIIEQYGHSSVSASGENNVVVGNIYQQSIQSGAAPQQSRQDARINATVKGWNNRVLSNTEQYNFQERWKY